MAKNPREHRVPIKLTEAELAAVDEFRFERRIATRSHAIRTLAVLGIGEVKRLDVVQAILSRATRQSKNQPA